MSTAISRIGDVTTVKSNKNVELVPATMFHTEVIPHDDREQRNCGATCYIRPPYLCLGFLICFILGVLFFKDWRLSTSFAGGRTPIGCGSSSWVEVSAHSCTS